MKEISPSVFLPACLPACLLACLPVCLSFFFFFFFSRSEHSRPHPPGPRQKTGLLMMGGESRSR